MSAMGDKTVGFGQVLLKQRLVAILIPLLGRGHKLPIKLVAHGDDRLMTRQTKSLHRRPVGSEHLHCAHWRDAMP
jgi:hypothetical protein